MELNNLKIINPKLLPEPGIFVDRNFKLKGENGFDNNIQWIMYGNPYETIIDSEGRVSFKYGFAHSFGYIEYLTNPEIKYDVLMGLLIKRIDVDYDSGTSSDSNSYSDSVSYTELLHPYKKIKTNCEHIINLHNEKNFFLNYNGMLNFEYGFCDPSLVTVSNVTKTN